MLQHYSRIAVRTLHKNPIFSIINEWRLMTGLLSNTIALHKLSWYNFYINKERHYRLHLNGRDKRGIETSWANLFFSLTSE